MILRFGIENFRSIAEYQEVLFTAASNREYETSIFKPDGIREAVLPTIAIYGANSSGKSNMLIALRLLKRAICLSATKPLSDATIPTFKLDKTWQSKPTLFDIDFLHDGTHFHYGFSISGGTVVEEWLYLYSYGARASRSLLFSRELVDGETIYQFGKHLKGKTKTLADITGDENLFLSIGAKSKKHKHPLLHSIADYFRSSYRFRFEPDLYEDRTGELILKYNLEKQVSSFLSKLDFGLSELTVKREELDEREITAQEQMRETLVAALEEISGGEPFGVSPVPKARHLITIKRKSKDGEMLDFTYGEESLGTKSLISILASVFWVLKNGGVLVVDELESSLHPLLSLKVVELFRNEKVNIGQAQLIFSTHETQLLSSQGTLREEVWFTEKCRAGSTQLTPLTDFSVSKKSNIENGYLDGRFGAIPFLGNADDFCLIAEDMQHATA